MRTAIIVGAGHRGLGYAQYTDYRPERLRIAGVADPDPERREFVARKYGLKPEMCFASAAELAARGKLADCVINGTMDADHVETTLPLLSAGYDVLLEKPFALNLAELERLDAAVRRTGRQVMICHVLRYAPFYAAVKRKLLDGAVGRITHIQSAEHVSYHHYTSCYVRGKWRSQKQCGASMLLAKCCHDIDLLTWYQSGVDPVSVASTGGCTFFRPENAPAGSGKHCLLDCPIEKQCDYSARRLHLNHPLRWHTYIWPELEYVDGIDTPENREKALRDPRNPYAQCVWKIADYDQADQQAVTVRFADGAIATHAMVTNTPRALRKVHIIGTEGEIMGCFEDSAFSLYHRDLRPDCEFTVERVDTGNQGDTAGVFGGHGGGDLRLMEDFIDLLDGRPTSISRTILSDSINGHKLVFLADEAMQSNRVIPFSPR